jgi:hypothetical protein
MKENLLALGIFIGFFLLVFSGFIIPITLLNDYLIYGCILLIGLAVSGIYVFYNKDKIIDVKEYIYIPIRCSLCFGPILVFSFLWLNFFWRDQHPTTIKIPVKSSFLFKERHGGKFSSKVRVKSAFVVNYKGQNKNIVWNSRLDDNLMSYVKEIEIIKRTGFFGIDIIEDTNLIYQ